MDTEGTPLPEKTVGTPLPEIRPLLDSKTKNLTKCPQILIEFFTKTTHIKLFSKGFSYKDILVMEYKWYNDQRIETVTEQKDIKLENAQPIPIYSTAFPKLDDDLMCINHFKCNLFEYPNVVTEKPQTTLRGFSKKMLQEIESEIDSHLRSKKMNESSSNILPSHVMIENDRLIFVKPTTYKPHVGTIMEPSHDTAEKPHNSKFSVVISKQNSLDILTSHLKKHFPPNSPMIFELNSIVEKLHDHKKEIHFILRKKKKEYKKSKADGENPIRFFMHNIGDRERYYYIISSESKITFYTKDGKMVGAPMSIDMVRCADVITVENEGKEEILYYLIGTYYGLLYIFDNKFKLRSVFYFNDAILKIRVVEYRYMVFTSSCVHIMSHDKKNDILFKSIRFQNEIVFDGDIFVDSAAFLVKKKESKNDFYIKVKDLTSSSGEKKVINIDETRKFIVKNGDETNENIKFNGYRLKIPQNLFSSMTETFFKTRFFIGIFPFNFLNFNLNLKYKSQSIPQIDELCKVQNQENLIQLESVESHITVVDFEGNMVVYSTTPL